MASEGSLQGRGVATERHGSRKEHIRIRGGSPLGDCAARRRRPQPHWMSKDWSENCGVEF